MVKWCLEMLIGFIGFIGYCMISSSPGYFVMCWAADHGKKDIFMVPSGNLTLLFFSMAIEMMSFPIQHGDLPVSHVAGKR